MKTSQAAAPVTKTGRVSDVASAPRTSGPVSAMGTNALRTAGNARRKARRRRRVGYPARLCNAAVGVFGSNLGNVCVHSSPVNATARRLRRRRASTSRRSPRAAARMRADAIRRRDELAVDDDRRHRLDVAVLRELHRALHLAVDGERREHFLDLLAIETLRRRPIVESCRCPTARSPEPWIALNTSGDNFDSVPSASSV